MEARPDPSFLSTPMKSPPTLNRPFPTEIFLVILSFCTPYTLAKVARTSHEFLALACPILYSTVRAASNAQLFKLFQRTSHGFKSTSKLKHWLKESIKGGGPDLLPTSILLPPPNILPFLSLAQIKTFHLSIPPSEPFPSTRQGTFLSFPFSRLLNTGTSSLNLRTLVISTSSSSVNLSERDSVYNYVKTQELVLVLLPRPPPATGEESCHPPMRTISPSATIMGIQEVIIVMEVGLGAGVYRPERLLGGLRRRGDEEGCLRFVLHSNSKSNSDPTPASAQELVDCLEAMLKGGGLHLKGWGGRRGALVFDVGSEEEKDAVEEWLNEVESLMEMEEEEKRCSTVVVRESRWWRDLD